MESKKNEAREARHGERMIELRVRFWTDELADTKGRIRPRHGWGGGVVLMSRNEAHGIRPKGPLPFNSLSELPAKIERILIDHGIKLHISTRERKYRVGE